MGDDEQMVRKLASIQIVTEVRDHDNADALELATVLGWQVVTRKDDVRVGDVVVYFEIDSMLPCDAKWMPASLVERAAGLSHFRVRTIKLRGQLSQGLILPLSAIDIPADLPTLIVGMDMTQKLGVIKYDLLPTSNTTTTATGNPFPSQLIDKTDETRIQAAPARLLTLANQPYYASWKFDGTSASYLIDPDTSQFLVCSRNQVVVDAPSSVYWAMARKYELERKLRANPALAVQGEICGPSVQANPIGLPELHFYVFRVWNVPQRRRLPLDEMIDTCARLEFEMVPIEERGDAFDVSAHTIPILLSKARGRYPLSKKPREGLVYTAQNQSTSFKVINNDYLLKQK